MNKTIGVDLGVYIPADNGYTITINQMPYTLNFEEIIHVENLTQGKLYYKIADRQYSNAKNISLSNNVITIQNQDNKPIQANDTIRINVKQRVSSSYPIQSQDIDGASRSSLNSVFGEKIQGIRRADIASQFQYGFPANNADSEALNGGTITTSESLLIVSTGTNTAGFARIANKKALRYLPGHEAYAYFTAIFTSPKADSYQRAGLFDENNGFFIGYEGSTFNVTRRRNAVDYNTEINISNVFLDGSYDPTKGNVYRISFGYLGFAVINFEILNPDGEWILIHKIKYPNSETVTHITNTNLQPRAEVSNTGNDSDIAIKTGSFTAGVVNGGGYDPAVRRFTFSEQEHTIVSGAYNYATFRSRETFNGLTNYIRSVLSLISVTTNINKSSIWEFRKGMTIATPGTWTDVNTNESTLEYSTDTVLTPGTGEVLIPFTLRSLDSFFEEVDNQELELLPQEYVTLVINTSSGANGTVDIALRWKELF